MVLGTLDMYVGRGAGLQFELKVLVTKVEAARAYLDVNVCIEILGFCFRRNWLSFKHSG